MSKPDKPHYYAIKCATTGYLSKLYSRRGDAQRRIDETNAYLVRCNLPPLGDVVVGVNLTEVSL